MHNTVFETRLKIGVVLLPPSNSACGFITLLSQFFPLFSLSLSFSLFCVSFHRLQSFPFQATELSL